MCLRLQRARKKERVLRPDTLLVLVLLAWLESGLLACALHFGDYPKGPEAPPQGVVTRTGARGFGFKGKDGEGT